MDLAREQRSSSNDLSSPPNSPGTFSPPRTHPKVNGALPKHDESSTITVQAPSLGVASPNVAAATNSRQDAAPPTKVKKARKRDPPTAESEQKEKPPKKARAAPRTKKTKSDNTTATPLDVKTSRPKAEASMTPEWPQVHDPPTVMSPQPHGSTFFDAAKSSQIGLSRQESERSNAAPVNAHMTYPPLPSTNSTPSTPRSTGIYDPVRSLTIQRPADSHPIPPSSYSRVADTPPRPVFQQPPSSTVLSNTDQRLLTSYGITTNTTNPTAAPTWSASGTINSAGGIQSPAQAAAQPSMAMDVDLQDPAQSIVRNPPPTSMALSDDTGSVAPTKAPRAKEQPPPLPQGSGLLSSTLFGPDAADAADDSAVKAPSIMLHVDLKGQNNQVINFARMAEEKYGFAALFPRLAAQKDRMHRIASIGAALERSASGSRRGGTSAGESADDDVSVDIDRDSDNDGDIAMSGLNGAAEAGGSGTDGPGTKKKRRKKIEEYDQEDPFVDDTELIWETQAAASKDGFFVYCGPLVPEGEKPAVERADGTVKRGRGRGRGGGVGSRGGRGAASTATASEGGTTKAGGTGTRGGNATRKPRITKADRAAMNQEKVNREKMAPIAARPAGYPGI